MAAMWQNLLHLFLDSNTPVFLSGDPGIGKTAVIEADVAARNGYLYLYQVAQRDPVDLTGAMHPVELEDGTTVTRYSTPEWVHDANAQAAAGRFVVIFLDEATTAAPMSLNATLTLVQSRKAGEYTLHPDIRFVIAGNPPGSNAGVYDLPAAFANRIAHVHVTPDADSWSEFILKPGNVTSTGNADADSLAQSEIAPLVTQFIRAEGSLHAFPKHETQQGMAWPSPRSWEQAIRNLAMARSQGLRDWDTTLFVTQAVVGEAAGMGLATFERDLDLPDPEELLKNPDNCELPKRQDQLFVTLAQLTGRVLNDFNAERHVAAWKILARVSSELGLTDVAATHARSIAEYIWDMKDKSKLGDFGRYLAPFVPMLKEAGLYKGGN